MATQIGNLSVALTALTKPFSKEIRAAGREVTVFAKQIASVTAKMTKFAVAGTAAASAAMAYFTHRQMESIDVTAKMSDRIGTSTEMLIGLQHAAKLAGVESEDLNTALTKMSKNLGNPSTDMVKALSAIHLDVGSLVGVDPAEQFRRVADGVATLGTQEQKLAVITALYGKSAAGLLPVFELTRKGLDEAQKDAEKLGITFSRIDGSKVEQANDAVTRLGESLQGIVNKLAIKLSPLITDIADKFTNWITSSAGVQMISKAVEGVAIAFATIVDSIGQIIQGIKEAAALADPTNFRNFARENALKSSINFGWRDLAAAKSFGMNEEGLQEKRNEIANNQAMLDILVRSRKEALGPGAPNATDTLMKFFSSNPFKSGTEYLNRVTDESEAKAKAEQESRERSRAVAGFNASVEQGRQGVLMFQSIQRGVAAGMAQFHGSQIARDAVSPLFDWFGKLQTLGARANSLGFGQPGIDRQTSTRGTFAGENASRLSGSMSIENKQLEQQKLTNDQLKLLTEFLKDGIPLQ